MIDEFKAQLGKRGFSKPTLFYVEFDQLPEIMNRMSEATSVSKDLRFQAENAEFPGVQIMTTEMRHYDVMQKFAYGKTFDDLNITFRMDRDFQVKRFFDAWIDSIYNRETGDVFYKNSYTGSIRVTQMMENGKSVYTIKMEDVFPTQVQSVQVGWDANGQYTKLNVVFSYKKYRVVANEQIFNVREDEFNPERPGTNPVLGKIPNSQFIPSGFDTKQIENDISRLAAYKPTLENVPMDIMTQGQIPGGYRVDAAALLSRVGSFSNNRLVSRALPYLSMGVRYSQSSY